MAELQQKRAFDSLFRPKAPKEGYVSKREELERVIRGRRLQGWSDEEIYIKYFKL